MREHTKFLINRVQIFKNVDDQSIGINIGRLGVSIAKRHGELCECKLLDELFTDSPRHICNM